MQKVFEVLFNQLDNLKSDNPGQRPVSHHLELLSKMPSHLLRRVFEGYSVPALQAMALARGLDAQRKRANLEQDLPKTFYDVGVINKTLAKLSAAAREGLYHIKRMGGLISLESWRMTLESRYGKKDTGKAQAELIGGLLALYGVLHTYGGIEFSFPYKSDLTSCGSFGSPVYLWTHSKVLSLYKVTPAEEAKYMERDRPQPYSGAAPTLPVTPGFDSLLADMISSTRYFEQNMVGSLVSGEPGKRDFLKLNEGLSVKEPGEIKTVKKIEDLGRLFFLWTLLRETQLVGKKVSDGLFYANQSAGEEFFSLPRYRQARLLAGAWVRCGFNEFKRVPTLRFHRMSYYESSLPDDRKLSQARLFLLGLLDFYRRQGSLPPGEWLDFSRLITAVRDLDANFLVNHDFSVNSFRENSRYGYEYDPLFPVQGYYGDEFYAGLTSTLKAPPTTKGGFRLPEEVSAPLKLSEDFALVEGEWLAQVFAEPLAWLGLAELGRDEKGRPLAFRLTDLGLAALADQPSERERQQADQFRQLSAHGPELTNALLAQPNFDVLVLAPLENLALLRQVDRFANQTSMGDVALYHITKDSVLRGLRSGLRGTDIIQTLRENNRVPVASNVVQSIEDWSVEFERLVLYENCHLLETPDATTLDRLMAQPGAARYVVKRLGATFALVTGELARPATPPKPAKPGSKEVVPQYLNYQALQPDSLSLEGTDLLKVKPTSGNPYLFYRLGQFAELETWNQKQFTATFRLTARAGQRAQQLGLTYDSVAQFLAQVLPRPSRRNVDQLAPETILALKGWLGYYGPLQAEKALALQVAQESQLAEIFELEEFKPALLGWAGPTIALVRESHFEQLSARLAGLGMPVNKPGTAALPAPAGLSVVEEKPKKGKRAVSEETTAERERKIREREEAVAPAQPNLLPQKTGPVRVPKGSELVAIMDLLDLMAGTGIAPDELERLLDDLDEDGEYIIPLRSRKKKNRDY